MDDTNTAPGQVVREGFLGLSRAPEDFFFLPRSQEVEGVNESHGDLVESLALLEEFETLTAGVLLDASVSFVESKEGQQCEKMRGGTTVISLRDFDEKAGAELT